MASVGPQLPSSMLEKRKRDESTSDSDDENIGPSLPPQKRSRSPEVESKRQRTIGPTMPPAALNERPAASPERVNAGTPERLESEEEDEDEEDGFGPHLPRPCVKPTHKTTTDPSINQQQQQTPSNQPTRDAWMLVPPSGSDWTSRVDPTKLRSRKFNTKPSSSSHPTDKSTPSIWHETPTEKQERLRREIMGIKSASTSVPSPQPTAPPPSRRTPTDKVQEVPTPQSRGGKSETLYTTHQSKQDREKDDDPSARAFDREKDIAGGMQINATRRREMLHKSRENIGSRFASAKYL